MNTKITCAWCGEKISDTKKDMGKDSHGICIKCYEKAMEKLMDIGKFKSLLVKKNNTLTKGIN